MQVSAVARVRYEAKVLESSMSAVLMAIGCRRVQEAKILAEVSAKSAERLSRLVAEAKGLPADVVEYALGLIARERGTEQVRNLRTAAVDVSQLAA